MLSTPTAAASSGTPPQVVPAKVFSGPNNYLGLFVYLGTILQWMQNSGVVGPGGLTFDGGGLTQGASTILGMVAGDFTQDGRTEYVSIDAGTGTGTPLTTWYDVTGTVPVTGLGATTQADGYNIGVYLPGSEGGQI